MNLSESELERYSRQLVMQEWSADVQQRLKQARAVVVGAGALGCPAATYLAAAGVGAVDVVDGDRVELSNLQRQPLHYTPDIGHSKADSASAKLGLLNPEVKVDPYPATLDEANAAAILGGADVVVDCSDSFSVRYLVNDVCCGEQIPLVEAGVLGLRGLCMSIRPGESACYRCVFAVEPADGGACADAGVVGAMAAIVGSIQALEAIKLVTGLGRPLLNRMLELDGAQMVPTVVKTHRRPDCDACANAEDGRQSG